MRGGEGQGEKQSMRVVMALACCSSAVWEWQWLVFILGAKSAAQIDLKEQRKIDTAHGTS